MRRIVLSILCLTGLALTLLPSLFVFAGVLPFYHHKTLMLLGFLLWFLAAPLWLQKHDPES